MLKAVIFDFDGVIADSELLHLEGFRHAVAAHDISISEADYFARYVGFDDHDGFTAILNDAGREASAPVLDELMASKARVFAELARERARIFPGVRELLADLRSEADPLPVAIGSGALSSEIELILGVAGLRRYIDTVVAADHVEHGKPHPETYLRAMAELARIHGMDVDRLRPDQCVVVEDTVAGLASAAAAGMVTIAVTNSYPAEALDADLVVDTLERIDTGVCRRLVAEASGESEA